MIALVAAILILSISLVGTIHLLRYLTYRKAALPPVKFMLAAGSALVLLATAGILSGIDLVNAQGGVVDVGISKTRDAYSKAIGDPIIFTLTVSNTGGVDTGSVVTVTDVLPTGTVFRDSSATQGIYDNITGIWTVGPLSAAQQETLVITAEVEFAGLYVNEATVSVAGDSDPTNNTSQVSYATTNNSYCYLISDADGLGGFGDDDAFGFNPNTGVMKYLGESDGGGNTLGSAENIAFDPVRGKLYVTGDAGSDNTFGTIDLDTGFYTPINDSLAFDFDGLSYNPFDQLLYASVAINEPNANPGDIYVINPTTGVITFVVATGLELDDIAIDPTNGEVYSVVSNGTNPDDIIKIDLSTGASTPVGTTTINDLEGLDFNLDGVLMGTTGNTPGAIEPNAFFLIAKSDGTILDQTPLPLGRDFEGSTCAIAATELQITKTDGVQFVLPGQRITYTLTITNATNHAASGVVVTDTIPTSTIFVSASNGGDETSLGSGIVTWTIGALSVGQSTTRTVIVDISDPAQIDIVNTARVSDTGTFGPDPNPGNNTTTDQDFLDTRPAAIGNYIWLDEDGDGDQDAGESGIANVVVELRDDATNTLVATTTTDLNGGYLFANLIPGDYTVTVDTGSLPAELAANPTFDEDGTLDNQTAVTLTAGEEHLTADFGYNWVPPSDTNTPEPNDPGVIGDRVWVDTDGDGRQDPGEPGLGGITVTLFTDPDGDGVYDTISQTTTTAVDGSYIFTGLNPSSYVVEVTAPAGYTQTGDPDSTLDNRTTFPVIIGPGDVYLNADFGYQPTGVTTSDIGDTLWLDADGDGSIDAGEPRLAGVSIALLDSSGTVIATDITDANGEYLFTGLPDGDYTVRVTDSDNVLGGLTLVSEPTGGNGDGSSDLTLSGADDLDQDFGYAPAGQTPGDGFIGDFIFLDANSDNSFDAGEPGLEGITVTLTLESGVIFTTTTNENGYYWFGNLVSGTYTVTVVAPTGLTNSVDPDGGTANQSVVTLTAGNLINLDQDFGYEASADAPNTISGTIWEDTNADGTLDGTETDRFDGVTVGLFDSNGNLISTATTDSDGDYSFTGLPNGTYTVDVLDAGNVLNGYWHSDGPNDGVDNNSQTDPYMVTVADGEINTTADFGYYIESGGLGNFVWNDLDGDGIQDAGEPGIPGITVTLTISYPNGAQVVLNTVTDASGFYTFTNLVLDEDYLSSSGGPDFTLTVSPPSGFTASPTGQGTNATDSNDPTGTSATVTQGVINDTYDFGFLPQFIDLELDKAIDNNTPNVGDNVRFTVSVINNGPSDATGVVISDVLPSGFTFVGASPSEGAYDNSTGLWQTLAISNGEVVTLTITATVNASGVYTNLAEVESANETDSDSTPGNGVDTNGNGNVEDDPQDEDDGDGVGITPRAVDLRIVKTSTPKPYVADELITYTLTVDNLGPTTVDVITITDDMGSVPLTGPITYTASRGNFTATTRLWTGVNLGTGDVVTLTIVSRVLAGTTGVISNTAVVTTSEAPDLDPSNNDDTDQNPTQFADLELNKAVNDSTPNFGDTITFSIVLSNAGPNQASGVQVDDILPNGLLFAGFSTSDGSTYNSTNGIWDVGGLNVGETITLTIVATVNTTSPLTNTAEVTDLNEEDPDSTPNNGVDTDGDGNVEDDPQDEDDGDGVVITPNPLIDLDLTKTVNDNAPSVGDNVRFTVSVVNNGPGDATGVVISDVLPSGFTFVDASASEGTYDAGTGLWQPLTISNGEVVTLSITATVNASGVYTNVAEVRRADQGDIDSTPGNVDTNPDEDDNDNVVSEPTEPTAISLLYFQADRQGDLVLINWETAVEIDNFGFRILRSATGSLTDASEVTFIPSQGSGTTSGATYSYIDQAAAAAEQYTYWLVDVDVNGVETQHTPVVVEPTNTDAGEETTIYMPVIVKQ